MLGPVQWRWLEEELTHSTARINILVSSTQVIPQDHKWEKWANFPASRQRLFALIRSSQVSGLIIISGDRHMAEISKLDDPGLPYPVYEVTSSGMTHSWHDFTHEPNRHRVGQVFPGKNFGTIDIQWTSDPEVMLRVHDEENEIVLWEFLRLSQISP
jgi:alkaline phosphatase D